MKWTAEDIMQLREISAWLGLRVRQNAGRERATVRSWELGIGPQPGRRPSWIVSSAGKSHVGGKVRLADGASAWADKQKSPVKTVLLPDGEAFRQTGVMSIFKAKERCAAERPPGSDTLLYDGITDIFS
jgi:hypothetical protein